MKPQGFSQPEMALKRLKIGQVGVALLRIVPKCNGMALTQQNGPEYGNMDWKLEALDRYG